MCLIFLTKKNMISPLQKTINPILDYQGIFRNLFIGFHSVKFLVIKVGQNGFSGFKAIKIGVTKENSNTLIFDKDQEAA